MKIRITLAAAFLALGFATITAARQGADPARGQAPSDSKAALRPKLARLRAEVELMQLEHEGDIAVMKDMIRGVKSGEANVLAADQATEVGEVRKPADPASVRLARKVFEASKRGFVERSEALYLKQLELLDLEQRLSMIP